MMGRRFVWSAALASLLASVGCLGNACERHGYYRPAPAPACCVPCCPPCAPAAAGYVAPAPAAAWNAPAAAPAAVPATNGCWCPAPPPPQ